MVLIKKVSLFVFLFLCGIITLFGCSDKGLKTDHAYLLGKKPVVTFNGKEIEVYGINQCIKGIDFKRNPQDCERVLEKDFLADKEIEVFRASKEGLLTITSPTPPGEKGEDKGDERREGFGLDAVTSNESALSPPNSSSEATETETIRNYKISGTPDEYIGRLERTTPNGSVEYVFKFKIEGE